MSEVNVKVGAETSALNTGLASAKEAIDSFKEHAEESFKDIGKEFMAAFAVGAIIESVKGLVEEFSHIQDEADKLGISAESFQKLGAVAKASGVDMDAMAKILQKGTKNAFEAATGNAELSAAFEALGIDAKEFANLAPEEQLVKLSEGYEKSGENAQSLDAITKALGKTGADIIPLLRKGPDEIKASLDDASAASNETVATLKEAGETMEHVWLAVKVAGAETLNFLITRTQALGTAIAAAVAYVSNLSHGFAAASQAASDVLQAAADLQIEKEDKRKEEAKQRRPVDTDALNAAKAKAEQEQKDAEELAKLKEQNAKKEEEAHMRSLTLLQKQKELQEDIAKLVASKASSPLDAERNKGAILDYQKELEAVNKDIAREQQRADEERARAAEKLAKDKAREELKKEKDALKDAEKNVSTLEKMQGDHVSVDNLRKIGGGLTGVNYNFNAGKDALEKQQLDYSRQQVEKLSAIVKALEAKTNTLPVYDGSFS